MGESVNSVMLFLDSVAQYGVYMELDFWFVITLLKRVQIISVCVLRTKLIILAPWLQQKRLFQHNDEQLKRTRAG